MNKEKIISVVGPTASGKSGLAIALAKQFNGEVISADSRQVYRGLDIGTAKVTPEEMDGIPHHMLDIADVNQTYTAADYKRDGEVVLRDIWERGKLPIIAGGTFFYVDALVGKIHLHDVPPNEKLRRELELLDTTTLFKKLELADKERAATIDPANRRRLIRSLELVAALGSVPVNKSESPYDVLTIGIKIDQETLRQRFQTRINEWMSGPFEAEVRELLDRGIGRERLHEIGFEYQLMLAYIDGEMELEEVKERLEQKNWQYAKRQMTWLKRDTTIRWFAKNDERIFAVVEEWL